MSMTKFASLEGAEVLGIKGSSERRRTASLDKFSDFEDFRTEDGYLYARIRAISSRVNKNHDGWPSVELAGGQPIFDKFTAGRTSGFTEAAISDHKYGYSTFLGKPIFVDHHNSNPDRARGVIVDSKLHVDDHKTAAEHDPYYASAPDNHMPPTWVELLLEVDAKSFPKLAKAIIEGSKDPNKGIDGFSMGCDVERSECNICKNSATTPDEYCEHIRNKGAAYDWVNPKTGHKESKKSYEDCYGIGFFEISAVFDPADETALSREVIASKTAADSLAHKCPKCESHTTGYTNEEDGHMGCHSCGHSWSGDSLVPVTSGANDLDDPEVASAVCPTCQGKGCEGCNGSGKWVAKTAGPELQYGDRPITCPDCNGHGVDAVGGGVCPTCSGEGYAVDPIQGHDGVTYPREVPQDMYNLAPSAVPGQMPSQGMPHLNKTAAPQPQSELIKAPEEVDTLREETVCPVCGSDMDEETCEVCGFIRPPEGFDTPDLGKAQDSDAQQEGGDVGLNPDTGPEGEGTSNSSTFAHVNNDVAWEVTSAYTNPDKETPVVPGSGPASDQPSETVVRDQKTPVTSNVRTAKDFIAAAGSTETRRQMTNHTADAASGAPAVATPDKNVDTEGVGGVLDASNEAASEADAQVDVGAQGGTGVEDVSADSTTNVEQGDEHSKNIESIPTKTFDDGSSAVERQESPVGGDVFPSSDEGVKASSWEVTATDDKVYPEDDGGLSGGSANPGTQPADPVGVADERVNVLEHVTSPENNSGPTDTWSGTDGNGVTQQVPAVTNETLEGEDIVNLNPKGSSTHIFAAFQLADLEVELGLIGAERKYARVAELEEKTPEQLIEALATTKRIKQAGLSKGQKTARRMPVLARTNQEKEGSEKTSADNEFQSDSQLFL